MAPADATVLREMIMETPISAHSSSDPMLDLRKAVADSKQEGRPGLSGELGKLKRPRGGHSTEASITIRHPKLNNNRWTNIPLSRNIGRAARKVRN